jgi:hypothetical protein
VNAVTSSSRLIVHAIQHNHNLSKQLESDQSVNAAIVAALNSKLMIKFQVQILEIIRQSFINFINSSHNCVRLKRRYGQHLVSMTTSLLIVSIRRALLGLLNITKDLAHVILSDQTVDGNEMRSTLPLEIVIAYVALRYFHCLSFCPSCCPCSSVVS